MVSMYNSGDWIKNRLQNLLQCNILKDIEIWCVNADSPDERDHNIPTAFAKKHKQIRYERLDKRISVYEAWNHIIQNSNSQFITNANTDDLVSPKCYQILINNLERSGPGIGLTYCSWFTASKPNQTWDNLTSASPDGKPGNYNGNIDIAGVGHFPLWRRNLHDQIGLFDTEFQALADADWWARIHFVSKKRLLWVNQNLALYLWRQGQNLWYQKVNKEEWRLYHRKVGRYKVGKL